MCVSFSGVCRKLEDVDFRAYEATCLRIPSLLALMELIVMHMSVRHSVRHMSVHGVPVPRSIGAEIHPCRPSAQSCLPGMLSRG